MQDTGLAFLNATLDVKAPTVVGDTIHVQSEVTVLEYNPLRLLKKT